MPDLIILKLNNRRPGMSVAGLIAAALCAVCFSGCASMAERDRSALWESLPIHTENSRSLVIESVHTTPAEGGLYVAGAVRKRDGHHPTRQSHVHVQLIGDDGSVVQEARTTMVPRVVPLTRRGTRGRSSFAVKFRQAAEGIVRIRLFVHGSGNCGV